MDPVNLPYSSEEEAQVLTFLSQLSVMREKDPTAFEQVAKSLGIAQDTDLSNFDMSSLMSSLKNKSSPDGLMNLGKDDGIQLNKKQPEMKSISITPDPGFTLKTKSITNDMKIFINICMHKDIFEPSTKKKLNEQGEEVEGLNIPMSVGPGRTIQDHAGIDCIVHDIIVNPVVIDEAQNDKTGKYKDFVCQLSMQCLEQKFQYELDRKYKLPKAAYKGTVESQRVQDRKNMPQIEEIQSKSNVSNEKSGSSNKKGKSTLDKSDAFIEELSIPVTYFWKRFDPSSESYMYIPIDSTEYVFSGDYVEPTNLLSSEKKSIVLEFTLSRQNSKDYNIQENISLNLSAYKLKMKAKYFKEVSVCFPFVLLPYTAQSTVSRSQGKALALIMRVSVDIDHHGLANGPDVGSKQWLLTHALGESDNPYDYEQRNSTTNTTKSSTQQPSVDYPEDRFHIRLPDGVDKYTGHALSQEEDSEELPEDAFHRKDASSSYLLEQRVKAAKDKAEKYERERHEKINDPNVEYIDFDDIKTREKYSTSRTESEEVSEMKISNKVILDAAIAHKHTSLGGINKQPAFDVRGLSSSLWADLL